MVVQGGSKTTEEEPTFLWFTTSLLEFVCLVLVLIRGAWSQQPPFWLVVLPESQMLVNWAW